MVKTDSAFFNVSLKKKTGQPKLPNNYVKVQAKRIREVDQTGGMVDNYDHYGAKSCAGSKGLSTGRSLVAAFADKLLSLL